MQVIDKVYDMRRFIKRNSKATISLVPTMGCLHDGHISLIQQARQMSDIVVTSIFVNPLQFGPNEDFNRYPRTLLQDQNLCQAAGTDIVFVPTVDEMYSPINQTTISVANLSKYLCGSKRIGHFDGVCTVVNKLFNIVSPQLAFFGKKDIQQLRIIETMVANLNLPVTIIGCETKRAVDGLALSSRNTYLSTEERAVAVVVPKLLEYLVDLIKTGIFNTQTLIKHGIDFVSKYSQAKIDYLEIVDYSNLQPIPTVNGSIIIATAIFVGNTRLIDNIIYDS